MPLVMARGASLHNYGVLLKLMCLTRDSHVPMQVLGLGICSQLTVQSCTSHNDATVQRHREGPDANGLRGDTHRTRTGTEQNRTSAQTPTPRPERGPEPTRVGPETTSRDHTRPKTNPGTRQTAERATRNPHLDPPAPRSGQLSQKDQGPSPMPPARPPPPPRTPACCSHIV